MATYRPGWGTLSHGEMRVCDVDEMYKAHPQTRWPVVGHPSHSDGTLPVSGPIQIGLADSPF